MEQTMTTDFLGRETKDPAASAEILAVMRDANHPYHDSSDLGHQQARADVRGLYEKAYGTEVIFTEHGRPAEAPPVAGIEYPALPDGFTWPTEAVGEIARGAGEIGVSPAEVSTWLRHAAEAAAGEGPDEAETLATLQAEWGGAFEKKLEAARLATQRIGPAFARQLEETGLGNDPKLIARLAALGEPIRAAKARYMAAKFTPDHPMHHPDHRDHAKAVAEMEQLRVTAFGAR